MDWLREEWEKGKRKIKTLHMCPAFAHTYISYFYADRSLKTDYYCKYCLWGCENETEFSKNIKNK